MVYSTPVISWAVGGLLVSVSGTPATIGVLPSAVGTFCSQLTQQRLTDYRTDDPEVLQVPFSCPSGLVGRYVHLERNELWLGMDEVFVYVKDTENGEECDDRGGCQKCMRSLHSRQ